MEEDEEENLFGERVNEFEGEDDYEDDEFHEEEAHPYGGLLNEEEAELDEEERQRMEYYIVRHPELFAELYRRQQQ